MYSADYADYVYSKFSRRKATSNFTTSNYFVINDLQTILYIRAVGKFIIFLRAKFRILIYKP
jgi:hypothetical protein